MKSFFKSLLIIVSILSVVGLVFIAVYYIRKNIKLFTNIMSDINEGVEDYELSNSEVDKIAEDAVIIKSKIEDEVSKDVVKVKKAVAKRVAKSLPAAKRKNDVSPKGTLNLRQKDVLNFVKTNSDAKMSSVSKMFNKVTPRTLRRDLEKLEQMGFLKQEGKTRDAVYKIV